MMQIESSNDYAVEVPGFGFVTAQFPYAAVSDKASAALYVSDYAEADRVAESVAGQYHRFALHEIANTVRVVQRTVTVSRGDWEPVDEPVLSTAGDQ